MARKGNQGGRGGADISKILGRGASVGKIPGPPTGQGQKVGPRGGRGVNDIREITGAPRAVKPAAIPKGGGLPAPKLKKVGWKPGRS